MNHCIISRGVSLGVRCKREMRIDGLMVSAVDELSSNIITPFVPHQEKVATDVYLWVPVK